MTARARTLVVIATYNEIENLPRLIEQLLIHAPAADILVIDDNSPDGTGRWCDHFAAQQFRVRCLHRPGKLGLGSAAIAGFQYALARDYELILTIDADFSHPPQYVPQLVQAVASEDREVDVAIGSRYVVGGGIEGWPFYRRLMSRAMNTYARTLLGLSVHDVSGAFRCYRTEVLRQIDFADFLSTGYCYLEEILWRLKRTHARFHEVPFVFVDRQLGQTKINLREAVSAVFIILRLGLRNWLDR